MSAAREVMDAAEKTLDEIESQLDILETGVEVVKGTRLVVIGIAAASFTVGAVLASVVWKKKLEKKYEERSEREIDEARAFYAKRDKTGEYSDPVELAERLSATRPVSDEDPDLERVREIARSYQSDDIADAQEKVEQGEEIVVIPTEVVNIFTQAEEDFNYEEELKNRSIEAPYVITRQEFDAGEQEFTQSRLTYYDGDDVLADEGDKPIPDSDSVVGDNNLLKFGHGSGDTNIVYIRNEAMELDFEVARHDGRYAQEVLGFIEHSDKRPLRRFRSADE